MRKSLSIQHPMAALSTVRIFPSVDSLVPTNIGLGGPLSRTQGSFASLDQALAFSLLPSWSNAESQFCADPESSQRVGQNGPLLLQDFHLIDLLAHFDRERIPERVVHAKGAGAYGEFEVTHDISDLVSMCEEYCKPQRWRSLDFIGHAQWRWKED